MNIESPTHVGTAATRGTVRSALAAIILALGLGWFFRELLLRHFVYVWSHDANWTHGWLIPVISLYFVWTRRAEWKSLALRPSFLGLAMLVSVMLIYAATSWVPYFRYEYPRRLCVPCGILAGVLTLWGSPALRLAWFPIAYLLLAVPIPQGWYLRLTVPLRQLASLLSGWVLALLPSVQVQVQNVVIDYVRLDTGTMGQLNIETACSGLRLMMSFLALGFAYAYLMGAPGWQRVVIVLACAPIAVLCNMVRVVVTGLFFIYDRPEWGRGTSHMLLGIVTLFLALGMFRLLQFVMSRLWIEDQGP